MQPSSDRPTSGGSSRSLRRYGPIAVIVVVVAVIGAIVLVSGGGDDSDDATDDTVAVADVGEGALSFSAAEEQGIEVDWPATCDTERGTVAIPNYFAAECYRPFEGDNGGATDTGVTEDTITIAYYQSPPNPISDFILGGFGITDTNEEALATLQTYVDLFNEYFETYGRTVEVVEVEGSGPPNDDVAARADAVRVDEEIGAFMVWGGPILTDAFADELAARQIPCISCQVGEPDAFSADRAPYVITVANSPDQGRAHLVEWLSKQVAGRPAEFAGEALQSEDRVFGTLFLESDEDAAAQNQVTIDMLADEDIDVAERIAYQLDPARLQEQAASAIARFKEAGVTSIIFSGDPVAPATFTTEATNQDYFPEWIITGSALTDTTAAARSFDQEQWSHAFGISSLAARLNPENSGSFYLYTWYTGEEPPAADTTGVILPLPQVFFGALQEVGPELTREAWVAALLAAEPTPDAISQPSLDWGDVEGWPATDYHGIDDWTEIWWDSESEGPSEIRRVEPGIYQYVDGGRRYRLGEWPEEDSRAFDPEGAVAFYEQPPEGEEAPDYPSPAG
ncbi:MAG TPA: ABC transporter substrate-binding protein [Acidimicrobiales bacterium]